MNAAQIFAAIIGGNMTNEELNGVMNAVTFARTQLARQTKRTLSVGSTVKFTSTKLGRELSGKVTKIAVKYVTVNTQAGLWKCPANMLEVV